jgi:hypothetical protein
MTIIRVDTAAIGKLGGEARARNLSDEERSESARKAAQARWAGHTKPAKKAASKKPKKGKR